MTLSALFVGVKEIQDATLGVGRVMTTCAGLEEAVTYLEWQLKSFSIAASMRNTSLAEVQLAILTARNSWNAQFSPLSARLKSATTAFQSSEVQSALGNKPSAQQLYVQWPDLVTQAENFGKRRNEVAHSTIAWSDGKIVRSIGRPWNNTKELSLEDDICLANEIGKFRTDFQIYTTKLGRLLPFADQDQILTFPPVGIDLSAIRDGS